MPNGIIKLKDNSLVKILIISPINFNLKSNLEKQAILNSYKLFLKTCNFNVQILIHSSKEDLSKNISKLESINEKAELSLQKLSKSYVEYIQQLNKERKSSCKEFYIMLKENFTTKKGILELNEQDILCERLSDHYFKIKECLSRCGNIVTHSESREMTNIILKSFLMQE